MKKIELAHDILAEEVFNNSSGLQRMRRKVESRISKKFSDFRDNEILVSKGELHNLILPYLGIVNISSEERSFVLEMERMHANKDAAKKKKYRNRIFGLIVITIFFIILSIFSLVQMTKAETELQQKKAILYAYSSVTALEEGYPSFAFHLAERALSFNELPEEYASQISREVIDKVYQQPLIKDISFDDKIITFKFFNSSDNFITCSEDGFLRLWSPNGRLKNEFELDGNVENLEILQNDKHISILSRDRKLSFYALENGDLIKVKDYTNVVSCKFYGNNYGLVAKENGKVLILETQKMEVLSSFHIGTYAAKTGLLIINGLKPYVLAKKEDQQIYLLNFDGELFFEEAFFDVSPIRREDEIESFSISQNGELIIFNTTKGDFILDNLGDILKINGTDFFSINQMDHSRSYFGPHGLEVLTRLRDSSKLYLLNFTENLIEFQYTPSEKITFASKSEYGKSILISREDAIVNVYTRLDKKQNEFLNEYKLSFEFNCRIKEGAYAPINDMFLSQIDDRTLKLWSFITNSNVEENKTEKKLTEKRIELREKVRQFSLDDLEKYAEQRILP